MRAARLRSLAAVVAEVQARPERYGPLLHVVVEHDDNCTPSQCRCEPTYRIEPLTPETFARGARGEEEWRRRAAS